MKKLFIYILFIFICINVFSQKYDAVDKYWLPQECSFNMQDSKLRFAANSNKNITLNEVLTVVFNGRNFTPKKLTVLCNYKVKYIEVTEEIQNFDILSPVIVEGSSPVRFDIADYLLDIEGNVDEKSVGNILIYISNASGSAEKSIYKNVTIISDIFTGGKKYSTNNFLVAYDYQTREQAETKFNEMCLPVLAKMDSSSSNFNDLEFMLLEKRNPNLLYGMGKNNVEYNQYRDGIATFLGGFKRLSRELSEKGYTDVEKMRSSMLLSYEIAECYKKIGKDDLAFEYYYHSQNIGRRLNEYKYVVGYLQQLSDIERDKIAKNIVAEMKTKGLNLSDASTFKLIEQMCN